MKGCKYVACLRCICIFDSVSVSVSFKREVERGEKRGGGRQRDLLAIADMASCRERGRERREGDGRGRGRETWSLLLTWQVAKREVERGRKGGGERLRNLHTIADRTSLLLAAGRPRERLHVNPIFTTEKSQNMSIHLLAPEKAVSESS